MDGDIVQQEAPPGHVWNKSARAWVPTGTNQSYPVSTSNEKFLGIKDQLSPEELKNAIMYRYLTAARTEEDGVPYFNRSELSEGDVAEMVMDEGAYHVHLRAGFEGMDKDLYERLKGVKDKTSGKSYVDTVTEQKLGIDQKSLENVFKEKGTKSSVVDDVVSNLTNQYLQQEIVASLQHEYGQDIAKYKAGILDLQNVHHVASKVTPEGLDSMKFEELIKTYVTAILEILQKLKK